MGGGDGKEIQELRDPATSTSTSNLFGNRNTTERLTNPAVCHGEHDAPAICDKTE